MDGIIINSVQGQVSKTFLLEQNHSCFQKTYLTFGIYVTALKQAHCQINAKSEFGLKNYQKR